MRYGRCCLRKMKDIGLEKVCGASILVGTLTDDIYLDNEG